MTLMCKLSLVKIRSNEIKLLSVLEYLEGDMVSSVTYTLYLPCKATSILLGMAGRDQQVTKGPQSSKFFFSLKG